MTISSLPSLRRLCLAASVAVACSAPIAARQQQAPVAPIPQRITDARSQMELARWAEAVRIFTDVLQDVNNGPQSQEEKRDWLVDVYLNRGVAYIALRDIESGKRDFRQMLGLRPTQELPAVLQPAPVNTVQQAFLEVQRTVVGTLKLRVVPADAIVLLGDVRMADPGAELRLASGQYTVGASRKSYATARVEIYVTAGELTEREISLVRTSSTVHLVTVPADVEVLLGTSSKGRTVPGPAPAEYQPALTQAKLRSVDASSRLEIADVAAGTYALTFRKPCYLEQTLQFDATELRDYTFSYRPFILQRAVGVIQIEGDQGELFLDGVSRGNVRRLTDECEGSREVQVRSAVGRYVTRVEVTPGSNQTVTARVRPALALLARTGEDFRGTDPRVGVAQAFGPTALTVFQPGAEELARAMKAVQVNPGWLSRQPENFTTTAMRDVSQRLAASLGVQAVAEVDVPSVGNVNEVVLTFVAGGSAKSDTVRLALDNPRTLADIMRRLDVIPSVVHQSVGLEVSDAFDADGKPAVVVVSVEPQSPAAQGGVVPGDQILKVGTENVAGTGAASGASAFASAVAAAKDGESIAFEMRDRSAAVKEPKRVSLRVTARPAVIAQDDQTLLPNRLIMEYRRRLASATGRDAAVVRLNLAVALMKVESFDDAVVELRQVTLGPGPGVSDGTVQYLLARCYARLGALAEEAASLERASKSEGAQLVVNGPLITELVKRERASARPGGRF